MPTNNYIKLAVIAPVSLHDADAVPRALTSGTWPLIPHAWPFNGDGYQRSFVTTWTFPFDAGVGEDERAAYAAALVKRDELRALHPELKVDAFQLSSFERTALESVRLIGEPIRRMSAAERGELEAVQ